MYICIYVYLTYLDWLSLIYIYPDSSMEKIEYNYKYSQLITTDNRCALSYIYMYIHTSNFNYINVVIVDLHDDFQRII